MERTVFDAENPGQNRRRPNRPFRTPKLRLPMPAFAVALHCAISRDLRPATMIHPASVGLRGWLRRRVVWLFALSGC
jgi:hypothetical protein